MKRIKLELTERQARIISLSLDKHSRGIRPWAEMEGEPGAVERFRELRDTYAAVQTALGGGNG